VTNDLCDGVPHPRLRALARLGVVRNYRKGAVLIEEGDQGSTVYIVLKGRLKAFTLGPNQADREVTYGVYGVGDLVGEMSLDGGLRSASVATLEASACAVVSKETLRQYIAQEPEFAFDLLATVIAKARRATSSTRSLALTDAYGRLVELLTGLAVAQPDGSQLIPHKLSQAQIAAHIGCSREMVSRLLKDLKTGGYIELTQSKQWMLVKVLPLKW
jgi:CRP/FNR family transcriptional regulator, cyclic AMP receptor protein